MNKPFLAYKFYFDFLPHSTGGWEERGLLSGCVVLSLQLGLNRVICLIRDRNKDKQNIVKMPNFFFSSCISAVLPPA